MKRSILPFITIAFIVCVWLGLLIFVYREGEKKEAIIYARIPAETIDFLNKLIDSIDQHIKYDPKPNKKDWDNDNNEGEKDGELARLEDENFIIYFARNNETEKKKAEKALHWAQEAIHPLTDLMGKYYYLCSYSIYGCLTKGIVIHPDSWKEDRYAKQTLWHEMNHYVFYTSLDYGKPITPHLWASEGIAEYFAKGQQPAIMGRAQINRLQHEHLNKRFSNFEDNYVGGHSVYTLMTIRYGKNKLISFLQTCYKEPMQKAYSSVLSVSEQQFESVWKSYLRQLP